MTGLVISAARRHVLVVGAQCSGAEELPGLENAARRLHKALVDPDLGACLDRGEGETGSLLVGTALGKEAVGKAITAAADLAKEDRGPLSIPWLRRDVGYAARPS